MRGLNKWHKEREIENKPKIRRNLIRAYQLQQLFDEGKITSLKQASEWLNISRSRLDHILPLLLLSPAIQTEIISNDDQEINLIPEYKVRSLASQADWNNQAQTWQDIKKNFSQN